MASAVQVSSDAKRQIIIVGLIVHNKHSQPCSGKKINKCIKNCKQIHA